MSESIRGLTGLSNLQASLSDNQTRMQPAPVHSEAGNSRVSQAPGTTAERVNNPSNPNSPLDPSRPSNGIPMNSWMSNSMQDIEGMVWRRRLELEGLRRDRQLDASYRTSTREPELRGVETPLAAAASTSQGSLFTSYRSVLPWILGGNTSMVVPVFHDVGDGRPASRGSDIPGAVDAAANAPSNSSNSSRESDVAQTAGDGVRHRPMVNAAIGEEQSQ